MIPAMSLDAKAETVANYGGQGYDSFEAAFEAAQQAGGDATIEIVGQATIDNKTHNVGAGLTLNGNGTLTVEDKDDAQDAENLFTGSGITVSGPRVDGQKFTGMFSEGGLHLWDCTVTQFYGGLAGNGATIQDKTSPTITDCRTEQEFLLNQNNPRWGTEWGNDTGLIENCYAKKAIAFVQKGAGSGDHRWAQLVMRNNTAPYDLYLHDENKGRFSVGESAKKILVGIRGSIQHWGNGMIEVTIEDPSAEWIDDVFFTDSGSVTLKNEGYTLEVSENNDKHIKGVVSVDGREYNFGKDQLVKAKSDNDVTWKVNGDAVAYGKSFFWTPQPGDKITTEEVKSELVPYTSVETESSFLVSVPESGDYDFKVKAADGTYGNITGLHLDADTQYRVTIDNMEEKTLEEVGVIKKNQA